VIVVMTDVQLKFDAFASSVEARLDHLNAVCLISIGFPVNRDISAQPEVNQTDRRSNIIIFGVDEDRDATK
jgi:hypothetical protein